MNFYSARLGFTCAEGQIPGLDFLTLKLSSFLLKQFLCLWISIASRCRRARYGVCCIKLLYCRKEFCGLDVLERVRPQKISPVEEDDSVSCVPLSWCLQSV